MRSGRVLCRFAAGPRRWGEPEYTSSYITNGHNDFVLLALNHDGDLIVVHLSKMLETPLDKILSDDQPQELSARELSKFPDNIVGYTDSDALVVLRARGSGNDDRVLLP